MTEEKQEQVENEQCKLTGLFSSPWNTESVVWSCVAAYK